MCHSSHQLHSSRGKKVFAKLHQVRWQQCQPPVNGAGLKVQEKLGRRNVRHTHQATMQSAMWRAAPDPPMSPPFVVLRRQGRQVHP